MNTYPDKPAVALELRAIIGGLQLSAAATGGAPLPDDVREAVQRFLSQIELRTDG